MVYDAIWTKREAQRPKQALFNRYPSLLDALASNFTEITCLVLKQVIMSYFNLSDMFFFDLVKRFAVNAQRGSRSSF